MWCRRILAHGRFRLDWTGGCDVQGKTPEAIGSAICSGMSSVAPVDPTASISSCGVGAAGVSFFSYMGCAVSTISATAPNRNGSPSRSANDSHSMRVVGSQIDRATAASNGFGKTSIAGMTSAPIRSQTVSTISPPACNSECRSACPALVFAGASVAAEGFRDAAFSGRTSRSASEGRLVSDCPNAAVCAVAGNCRGIASVSPFIWSMATMAAVGMGAASTSASLGRSVLGVRPPKSHSAVSVGMPSIAPIYTSNGA